MRARRKQGRGRTENRTRVPPVSASSCVFMEFVRVGLMSVTVRLQVLEDALFFVAYSSELYKCKSGS